MKSCLELLSPGVRRVLKTQPEKGFTLIELMVVIACVALLTATTAPYMLQYLREAGLRQAVYQLSGDLYRKKSQAVRTQAVQTINFFPANNTYTCTNPAQTINLGDYWGNVVFTANPSGPEVFSPTISFDARGFSGLVPAATTQVYLTHLVPGPMGLVNGRIFRIQVSAVGAVSIHEWRSGTWSQ